MDFWSAVAGVFDEHEQLYKKTIQKYLDADELEMIKPIEYNINAMSFFQIKNVYLKEFKERPLNGAIFDLEAFIEELKQNNGWFEFINGPTIEYTQDCNGGYLHTTAILTVKLIDKPTRYELSLSNSVDNELDFSIITQ